MKTSHRKYNEQYRDSHLYVDGYWNPEIVPECNEHKRCDVCRCHVKETGLDAGTDDNGHTIVTLIYTCPTCGKSYGVQYDVSESTDEPWASINGLLAEYGDRA